MASLRELKKRLQSVKTTGQLAGAMRTVSTAKYSRASAQLNGLTAYSDALRELYGDVEGAGLSGAAADDIAGLAFGERPMLVLASGNRGLCGGYNHKLFAYFIEEVLPACGGTPLVTAVGRMAAEFCHERGIELYAEYPVSDVPTFDEAQRLEELLKDAFDTGAASSICFVHQRFINMMKQTPSVSGLLPVGGAKPGTDENEDGLGDVLFVPDEETVRARLVPQSLANRVYTLLLQCASGSQAATLLAMRTAYDNAEASAKQLETIINRRRQSEVTQSVLETSADNDNYQ